MKDGRKELKNSSGNYEGNGGDEGKESTKCVEDPILPLNRIVDLVPPVVRRQMYLSSSNHGKDERYSRHVSIKAVVFFSSSTTGTGLWIIQSQTLQKKKKNCNNRISSTSSSLFRGPRISVEIEREREKNQILCYLITKGIKYNVKNICGRKFRKAPDSLTNPAHLSVPFW